MGKLTLTHLLVILFSGEMHPEICIVVVRREFGPDRVDTFLSDCLGVTAAFTEDLRTDSLARIARFNTARGVLLFITHALSPLVSEAGSMLEVGLIIYTVWPQKCAQNSHYSVTSGTGTTPTAWRGPVTRRYSLSFGAPCRPYPER